MRTTPSRFNSFTAQVDANLEGRPASGAAAPEVEQTGGPSSLSILERRHPSVIQTLRLLWGFPELNQYFERVYSGEDASLSLAPDAMAELMLLASVHQRICPHRLAKPVEELYGGGRWSEGWKPARLRR
jgi:hypothetical protein